MRKYHHAPKGFTIIESLVAISIIVAVVVAATGAIQSGISTYSLSKEQIVAFYLAQEGFEQLKNIRDENSLAGRQWLSGIAEVASDPCYFGQACTVSPVETALAIRCAAPGSCPYIRQDPVNGFYGYNALWPLTIYKREITLTSVNQREMTVKVTLYWTKGTLTRQFSVKENLYDWQAGTI